MRAGQVPGQKYKAVSTSCAGQLPGLKCLSVRAMPAFAGPRFVDQVLTLFRRT